MESFQSLKYKFFRSCKARGKGAARSRMVGKEPVGWLGGSRMVDSKQDGWVEHDGWQGAGWSIASRMVGSKQDGWEQGAGWLIASRMVGREGLEVPPVEKVSGRQ